MSAAVFKKTSEIQEIEFVDPLNSLPINGLNADLKNHRVTATIKVIFFTE